MNDSEKFADQREIKSGGGVFAVGTIVDKRFKIIELRGRGANGEVYRAENQMTGDIVALKVLARGFLTDERDIERFFREAKLTSGLQHSGIVAVRAFGKTPTDDIFMVMEFVEGKTLAELIKEKTTLTLPQLLGPLCQVLDALAFAHEHNVVHRDIKPSNIMITDFGQPQARGKILDFGLAQLHESSTEQSLTKTGAMVGTPAYMSPERCRGENALPASDIYSFGCTLFEALTGETPFSAGSSFEMMSKHLHEPPSMSKARNLSPRMKEILLRCLAKDRSERYYDARQVRDHLQQEAASTPSHIEKKRTISLPGRKVVVLSVVALASLAVAGVFIFKFAGAKVGEGGTQSEKDMLRKADEISLPQAQREALYNQVIAVETPRVQNLAQLNRLDRESLQRLVHAHMKLAYFENYPGQWRMSHILRAEELVEKWPQSLHDPTAAEFYTACYFVSPDNKTKRHYAGKAVDAGATENIRLETAMDLGLASLRSGDFGEASELFSKAKSLESAFDNKYQDAKFLALQMACLIADDEASAEARSSAEKGALDCFSELSNADKLHVPGLCFLIAETARAKNNAKVSLAWVERGLAFDAPADAPELAQRDALIARKELMLLKCDLLADAKNWKELLVLSDKGMLAKPLINTMTFAFAEKKGRALFELGRYPEAENQSRGVFDFANRLGTPSLRLLSLHDLLLVESKLKNAAAIEHYAQLMAGLSQSDLSMFDLYHREAETYLKAAKKSAK
jgi:serine/threonine protein kinase